METVTEQNMASKPEPAPPTPRPGTSTPGSIPLPPKIESKDLGLKVLVQPKETDEVDVDFVAVHGLAVYPVDAWVHRETKVNWLSDETMLPAALPKARIMAFNYQSYWFGDDAVQQSVDAVSGQLLTALDDKRRECRHRPIIFIGHCFGGLVIQRAYECATSRKDLYPGISDSITGIAFLGTPHRGVVSSSSMQTQGQIYQAIARAEMPIHDNVLHTMAQDNDLLVRTVHEFTSRIGMQGDSKPALYCFFEQKACKVGLIAGMPDMPKEFVVGQSSATFDTWPKEGLALDHFGMNKFEHAEDGSYDQVRRQLAKMAENSNRIMDGRGLGKTARRGRLLDGVRGRGNVSSRIFLVS